jgi:hypothetical protein
MTVFLVFYRKFAPPSKLLSSLMAKFEEASELAIDYTYQIIIQSKYPLSH